LYDEVTRADSRRPRAGRIGAILMDIVIPLAEAMEA